MLETETYTPKYPVLSLEKALDILGYIEAHGTENGLSLAELSLGLDMKKSSVHRILDTLYAYKFVEKTLSGNRYKLGWGLYHLGNSVPKQHNLSSNNCIPIMKRLCQTYTESFTIGIWENNVSIITYNVEPNIRLKSTGQIGEMQPLYATAKGKLFLSQLPDTKIYDFYRENKIEAHTNHTLTTPRKMLDELQQIRKRGYAIDNEEHCEGLTCMAMPIRNLDGKIVAALSASGPTQRILPKITNSLKEDLKEACIKLSNDMGYQIK